MYLAEEKKVLHHQYRPAIVPFERFGVSHNRICLQIKFKIKVISPWDPSNLANIQCLSGVPEVSFQIEVNCVFYIYDQFVL